MLAQNTENLEICALKHTAYIKKYEMYNTLKKYTHSNMQTTEAMHTQIYSTFKKCAHSDIQKT